MNDYFKRLIPQGFLYDDDYERDYAIDKTF